MNNNMFPNQNLGELAAQSTQPPIQNIPGSNIQGSIPGINASTPLQSMTGSTVPGLQPPYAENILKQNQGKVATFYMSYSDSVEWRDKVFTGVIEDSGRDYALLSDPQTGKWTLLWLVYINYVEFDEPIIHL